MYASSIQTWLEHHARLGVERVYLHLEESEALAEMLRASRWAGVIELTEARDTHTHYFEKVSRQNAAVSAAIPRARAAGLTHLLHIDDDELLYTSRAPCRPGARARGRCRFAPGEPRGITTVGGARSGDCR